MKKAFFAMLALVSFSLSAQTTKELPMSIQFYDAINKIKESEVFTFIEKHDKMFQEYDSKGTVTKTYLKGKNYIVETADFKNFYVNHNKDWHYYLTIFKNQLIGHSFVDDTQNNRMVVNYIENKEIVKSRYLQKVNK